MKIDNPQAFRFIMQDEIYLLDKDKGGNPARMAVTPASTAVPEIITVAETPAPEANPIKEQVTEPGTPVVKAMQEPQPHTQQTSGRGFNYLGKNKKNFLILVNYPTQEHIAPDHLAALENILKRKELLLDDVAILNVNAYAAVNLTDLAACFAPTRLVIMGKDSLPAGIGTLPFNQPLQGKKTHVLYSFSFDEMMSSNENKKTFWEHMKKL